MASGPIVRRWRAGRLFGAGCLPLQVGVGEGGGEGGWGRGPARRRGWARGGGRGRRERRRWAEVGAGRRQGGRGRRVRTAGSGTGVRRARTTGASGNGGPGRICGPSPARPGRAGRRQRPNRGFGASLAAASRPPVAVGSTGLCSAESPSTRPPGGRAEAAGSVPPGTLGLASGAAGRSTPPRSAFPKMAPAAHLGYTFLRRPSPTCKRPGTRSGHPSRTERNRSGLSGNHWAGADVLRVPPRDS